jgi:anaerobic glycerol-3-phosphate dehydrogenase
MVNVDVAVVGEREAGMRVARWARSGGSRVAVVSSDNQRGEATAGIVELIGRVVDTQIVNGRILLTMDSGERIDTSALVPAIVLDPSVYCSV